MTYQVIISSLLFLLPGILGLKWIEYLSSVSIPEKNTTTKTVIVLVHSISTVALIIIVLNCFFNFYISTTTDFLNYSSEFSFLAIYLAMTLLFSFLVAWLYVTIGKKALDWFINLFRGASDLSHLSNESIWGKAFDSNKSKIIYITNLNDDSNGQWGFFKSASLPKDGTSEILLLKPKLAERLKNGLSEPEKSYIDLKSKTVIYFYSLSPEIQSKLNEEYIKTFGN